MSLARQEMAEQPAVLERLLRDSAEAILAARTEIAERRPRFGVIAARGSSDNAARYAQHLFGRRWAMPVGLATPSLHTLYDAPLDYSEALVIGISQSGASPDVAAVVETANDQGAVTIAITNEAGSTLAAGRPATSSQLRTGPGALGGRDEDLHRLAGRDRRARGRGHDRRPGGDGAPARRARCPAEVAAGWKRLAVVGRGVAYGTAFEAALKLSELTGMVAAPYSTADFLHGPIAIVEPGFPILAIAPSGPTLEGIRELLERASEADITVITDAELPGRRIALEAVPEALSPLVAVIPAQQLAVGAAEHLGKNVDRPTGLEKVTLTS